MHYVFRLGNQAISNGGDPNRKPRSQDGSVSPHIHHDAKTLSPIEDPVSGLHPGYSASCWSRSLCHRSLHRRAPPVTDASDRSAAKRPWPPSLRPRPVRDPTALDLDTYATTKLGAVVHRARRLCYLPLSTCFIALNHFGRKAS
jgi:hypothetical protein